MQGTDLDEQVVGWIKLSLPLSRRPPRVAILGMGGHQTRRYVRINLLEPRVCAATSGTEAIGYLEPRDERSRKLLHTLSCGVLLPMGGRPSQVHVGLELRGPQTRAVVLGMRASCTKLAEIGTVRGKHYWILS